VHVPLEVSEPYNVDNVNTFVVNWLTFAWSACAGACALLALLHLLIWIKQRPAKIYLLSSLMAFAAAANALAELSLLHTVSMERYVSILKLENFFVAVILVSMVWFVDLRFKVARRWLTLIISAMWSGALTINILSPQSLVFSEIDQLTRLTTFWGEPFTIALGETSPWKWLADVATVLITIHAIDSSIRLWRMGNRELVLRVGGSIVFFIVVAGIHTPLVDTGLIATPYMVSFAFLAIVLALSYDLVNEVIKVPRVTRELESTRREMDRVMRANVLGELSSTLAHELNQPLTAILSNAQAAQRILDNNQLDAEELSDILKDIVHDDKRASEIIHRLRRLLARGEIKRERLSFNGAVDEVIKLVENELHAQQCTLSLEKGNGRPMIDAGRTEIQQVIMNLILNAMRAMEGQASVNSRITIKTGSADGYVRLAVEDMGPGIDEDNFDRIFEPLFSTRAGGLGMGLAISRRIIEHYGGELEAENKQHGGARFWFTLPAAEDAQP
jgi:signal transduction histidine kinase